MKKYQHLFRIKLLLLILILSGFQLPVNNQATGSKVKLYVIGDSTASLYSTSFYPRNGWAQVLQAFFNPDSVEVVDKALSGRSSKSFYTDSQGWPSFSGSIAAGDYLFIQFGHNDQKTDIERFTDPYTTYKKYLKKYIDEARAKGAIPVLLTSIHRNLWTDDHIKDTHGHYPPAMRELAAEENVPLIDLTQKTESLFEAYGEDYVTNEFFMNLPDSLYKNYPDGNSDNSHLQVRGAYEVSKLVFRALTAQSSVEEIAKLFRSSLPAGYVKTLVDKSNMGEIEGAQVVPMDSTTTFKAESSIGFAFDYFSYKDNQYPEPEISIELVDSVQELTAYFTLGYNVKISVNLLGKADFEGYGSYAEGKTVTVVAIPDEGYMFVSWTLDGNIVSTDPIYTFVMGNEDIELEINVEEATSVIDQEYDEINISYNPQNFSLSIHAPKEISMVQLFDIHGKIVRTFIQNCIDCNININDLSTGIYIARVHSGNQVYSGKILKQY